MKYLLSIAAIVAASFFAWRAFGHRAGEAGSKAGAGPTVAAAEVERGDLARTITLTAEFRAYQEVDIHSKVAGFVQSIPVDIGDLVKQGDVLAILEIPELQEDLKKAAAGVDAANEAVKEADATYQGIHLDFTRLQQVAAEHPKLVAQQEIDNLRAKDQAGAAALANAKQRVEGAQAEQNRDLALVDYSKIAAPFTGVVTKRYADVGALIQAGASSGGTSSAVIRFAQEDVLRTMFPVPESAIGAIKEGVPVTIQVSGLNRTVKGNVTRYARQLNPESRTMETEVDLKNEDLSITPGMYGWATLTLEERKGVLSVPVEAMGGGENPSVLIVNQEHKLEERRVKVGLETPNRIEIVSGLQEHDLVFVGNRSRVQPGTQVQTKLLMAAQTAY
jgi:RND family efflux transporter MFP subunit